MQPRVVIYPYNLFIIIRKFNKIFILIPTTMSFTIALSANSATLQADFHPPIYLDPNISYVVGLTNFETFNAIPNIHYNNNKIYFGKNNEFLTIPTGSYEMNDINKYLQTEFQKRDISFNLYANNNTLKSTIVTSTDIIFKKGTIGKILGFNDGVVQGDKVPRMSENPAEIIKVNSLCIDCSIAEGSYLNGKPVHIIHQFFPNVSPGYKIIESPQNIIYFPVTVNVIDKITIKIVDQDLNLVDFRNETVTIRLHIKEV